MGYSLYYCFDWLHNVITQSRTTKMDGQEQKHEEKEQHVYTVLDSLSIPHSTLYHPVIKTMDEGKEIMKKLTGTVCVNILLFDKKGGNTYLVIKNMTTKMKINEIGKSLGISGLTMAPIPALEAILKVPPGCATVLAIYNSPHVTVLIDNNVPKDQPVNFHPMRSDATTTISFSDMIKYVNHCGNPIMYF